LNADGQTGSTGAGSSATDVALSQNSQFMFVLAGGSHQVVGFNVNVDGSLTGIGQVAVPAGATWHRGPMTAGSQTNFVWFGAR
jgi:hypothetical protein